MAGGGVGGVGGGYPYGPPPGTAPSQSRGYYGGAPNNYSTPVDYYRTNAQHEGLTPAELEERTANGGTVKYTRDPAAMLDLISGRMSSATGGPMPAPPGGSMPMVEGVAEPDSNAYLERTKDRVGNNTRASMNALRDVMASAGTLGSGREARAMTSVVNQGQGEESEAARRFEENNLQRARSVNDRNFAANQARTMGNYQGGLSIYDAQMRAAAAQRQSMLELYRSALSY